MNGGKAIINDIEYCKPATPAQFLKTSTAAAAPVALKAAQTYFRRAVVLGKNALDGTNNGSDVHIGPSSSASEQPYTIHPGEEVVLEAPLGAKWNFVDWFLDVDADNDGVVIIYS